MSPEDFRHLNSRHDEHGLPEGLGAFESALAGLVPRGDRLNRDLVMFRAGQASVSHSAASRMPGVVGWQLVSLAASAVAASLLFVLISRSAPHAVPTRIVESPQAIASAGGRLPNDGGHSPAADRGGSRPQHEPDGPANSVSHEAEVPQTARLPRFSWFMGYSRGAYLDMLNRMLGQDLSFHTDWLQAARSATEGVSDRRQSEVRSATEVVPDGGKGPLPYRQQLRIMLDQQARSLAPHESLEVDSHRGA